MCHSTLADHGEAKGSLIPAMVTLPLEALLNGRVLWWSLVALLEDLVLWWSQLNRRRLDRLVTLLWFVVWLLAHLYTLLCQGRHAG